MASGRKFFVGGNWKMNGNKSSIDEIITFLSAGPLDANAGIFTNRLEILIDQR